MNEHEQRISDAARAMGRKGGLVRNPNKGFGSGDNAVQAAKARWEGKMSNDNDGSFVLRGSMPENHANNDVPAPVMEKGADWFKMTVGQRLRMLRDENSLSRRKVAEKIEVSVASLINWEGGDTELSASKIAALADLYDVSCDYLLLRVNERHGIAPSMRPLPEQPEQSSEPSVDSTEGEDVEQPSEPVNHAEPEQPVQPSEPESLSQPEQQTQPPMPMCKDCPLVATVQSLSTAIALSLSRR